jgi:hypothetical protein
MRSGRASLVCSFLAVSLLIIPTRVATAFDGRREGFLLAFGVGVGNLSISDDLPAIGAQTDLRLGFGVSDRVSVYYTGKQFWYKAEDLFLTDLIPMVGVTYRLQPSERSLSVSFGGGASLVAGARHHEWGAGVGGAGFVGMGYQFARRWQVELDVIASGLIGSSAKIYNVGLTLNVLAY